MKKYKVSDIVINAGSEVLISKEIVDSGVMSIGSVMMLAMMVAHDTTDYTYLSKIMSETREEYDMCMIELGNLVDMSELPDSVTRHK